MTTRRRSSLFLPLTAMAVAISLASTLLLFSVVRWTVMRESERVLTATIDTDIAGLADIYLSGGQEELIRRLGDRIALSQQRGENVYYRVGGPDGAAWVGNIDEWPALATERSELGTVEVEGHDILARATQFSSGVRIVVGRSLDDREALLARIARAFMLAGGLAALLSLAAGAIAAGRLRRRVEAVNCAFAAIEQGDLQSRAPGAQRADELGELATYTNRMLDQVERLISAHRSVSDHLAHEIRTPLMHLDSQLRAASAMAVDGRIFDELAAARGQVRNVVRLLDSLLDIAGAEALKGDLRGLGEIDLSEIALSLADLYEDSADERGLDLVTRIEPSVTMRGDAMQLTRLLTNLLDNALKYVPAGGTVRLTVAAGPRIAVEDNGPGISAEHREQVFERYWRGNESRQDSHGMGLALARAVAERHGLTIRVEDAGPGARFIVERGR